MPIIRSVIQHSIRRPMYPASQINTTPQRIKNDIIKVELERTTEVGVRNLRKSTLKCNCRLTLKKLLRQGNCISKDIKKEIDIENIPDEDKRIRYGIQNDREEAEITENDSLSQMTDINVENDIIAPEISQEKLKMEIENMFENVAPKFEAPRNYSNYFGDEIENPVNKSEIDEETEQELQGKDEFKVNYDDEQTIEHAQMLQANDENAQILQPNEEADISKPNDKLTIEILENIVIKHAPKSHAEILKTIGEIIDFKKGNSSSKVDSIDDVTAQEVFVLNSNVIEQINDGKDKILQANNEIVLKQTNSNVEGIHNSDPKNNEHKIYSRDTEITVKSNNKNTEKAPQFDNFKVPKEVTHSKKKRVKKQQPRFVLTHVVGGHIIQESNFAFPVREPQSQKNKPQSSNTEVKQEEKVIEEDSDTKETPPPTEVKEEETAVQEECITVGPTLTEVTEELAVLKEDCVTVEPAPMEVEEDIENGEFNPFAQLQQSTVKSWAVGDLSTHLLKCDWEETASLLQDNEIDGASLFMVTKTQLMIIGVNEEQADVISEFVHSGSSKGN